MKTTQTDNFSKRMGLVGESGRESAQAFVDWLQKTSKTKEELLFGETSLRILEPIPGGEVYAYMANGVIVYFKFDEKGDVVLLDAVPGPQVALR